MHNREMSRTLKWIAVMVVAVGVICSAVNIAHFNDRNLGLMVGIGFLVGGIQILVFGAIAPLMQRRQEENNSPLMESAKD
jgi:EamA domain-containing membrane protein RarD